MKTQKKGFTLIELMVVIVIIGILAAIAIPKLFGMSAKAKAQEVPGAAGTWSKLQTAYIVETGKLGGNQKIAYLFPAQATYDATGTSSGFTYGVDIGSTAEKTATTDKVLWTAGPRVKLNDCPASASQWQATMDFTAVVTASVSTTCESLTPNFNSLK